MITCNLFCRRDKADNLQNNNSAQTPDLEAGPGKDETTAADPATPQDEEPEEEKSSSQEVTEILHTILAHQRNVLEPGTFNATLNELRRRSGLAPVDVGDDWPSSEILAKMA